MWGQLVMGGQPPSAALPGETRFRRPAKDSIQMAHCFWLPHCDAVSGSPHSVRLTTTIATLPCPNPRKINAPLLGPLRALFHCAAQQQEVTNHDTYQPVSHRDR